MEGGGRGAAGGRGRGGKDGFLTCNSNLGPVRVNERGNFLISFIHDAHS